LILCWKWKSSLDLKPRILYLVWFWASFGSFCGSLDLLQVLRWRLQENRVQTEDLCKQCFNFPLFQLCSRYTSSLQRRHVFNWICCGFSYVLYSLVSRTFLLYSNPVFGVLHSVIKLLQVLVQGCKLPGRSNVLSRDLFWNYGVRCS